MGSSLSNLSNLAKKISQGIHRIKCKRDDLIDCKYWCCNKNYQRNFDEKLRERIFDTYKFFNHGNALYCCRKVFIFMNI